MLYFLKCQLTRGRSGRSAVFVDTLQISTNHVQMFHYLAPVSLLKNYIWTSLAQQAGAHISLRGGKRGKTRGEDRGGSEGS